MKFTKRDRNKYSVQTSKFLGWIKKNFVIVLLLHVTYN